MSLQSEVTSGKDGRMDISEVIEALRCSSTAGMKCKGESCRYWCVADPKAVAEFNERHDAHMTVEDFSGCDCDKIALTAADLLEGMIDDGK